MKRIAILMGILAILSAGVFAFVRLRPEAPVGSFDPTAPSYDGAEPTYKTIGNSVEGRAIDAYTYGKGSTHLLFVGGMHGGYEWNTVLLPYTFMDYLALNPNAIPDNVTVTVIPSANPDGLYAVVGKEGRFTMADVAPNKPTEPGRFNANNVDLNRNFDCNWKPEGKWRNNVVSAGSSPFSEPEAQAIRDFVLDTNPSAVIFWHSQANAVYPGECGGNILEETRAIMNAYAGAAGYRALESFDDYEVTGSADGWVASRDIPALTVELQTHETIEWERNLSGVRALFEYYGSL